MTCTSALAAFNAVMAADPLIQVLGERAWGDVIYEQEQEQEQLKSIAAPKKVRAALLPRCMVADCCYVGSDVDEHGVCTNCWANSAGSFKMRSYSEMTMPELMAAKVFLDEERRSAKRSRMDRWQMDNLNAAAQEIQDAMDQIIKTLNFNTM
jgi:hypothetical protein